MAKDELLLKNNELEFKELKCNMMHRQQAVSIIQNIYKS